MQDITNHFVTIVLFVGACLIFVSYLRIRRLIEELPKGAVQKKVERPESADSLFCFLLFGIYFSDFNGFIR